MVEVPWRLNRILIPGIDKQSDIKHDTGPLAKYCCYPEIVVVLLIVGQHSREEINNGADTLRPHHGKEMVSVPPREVKYLIIHERLGHPRNRGNYGNISHVFLSVPLSCLFINEKVLRDDECTYGLKQVEAIVEQVLGVEPVLHNNTLAQPHYNSALLQLPGRIPTAPTWRASLQTTVPTGRDRMR